MRIKDFVRPFALDTDIVLVDPRTKESERIVCGNLLQSPEAEMGFWSARVMDGTLVLMTTPSRTDLLPLKEFLQGDFAACFEVAVKDAEGNILFKGEPRNVPTGLLSRRVRSMSAEEKCLAVTLAVKFRTIWVSPLTLAFLDNAMQKVPASEEECFRDTFTCTADFGGGIQADVKCCGVRYREGGSNLPWTEAVLFKDGAECCYSEIDYAFEGTWELAHDGTEYVVDVRASSQDLRADYVVTRGKEEN